MFTPLASKLPRGVEVNIYMNLPHFKICQDIEDKILIFYSRKVPIVGTL